MRYVHAVRSPCCLVAHAGGELVAALEYRVRPYVVSVEGVGSRQVVRGAAWALEFELARQAVRRQLPARATFLPDARGFHRRIGRRLGQPTYFTSAWTLADCRFIVDRVTALLA